MQINYRLAQINKSQLSKILYNSQLKNQQSINLKSKQVHNLLKQQISAHSKLMHINQSNIFTYFSNTQL